MNFIIQGLILLLIIGLLPFVGGLIQWLVVIMFLMLPIALSFHIYKNQQLIHAIKSLWLKGKS